MSAAAVRVIHLTQGMVAIVDEQDYEMLSQHKWFAAKGRRTHYAHKADYQGQYKKRIMRMHRMIMCAKSGDIVDHINGNGLDNRRANLRIVTHAQNCGNRTCLRSDNTSGVNGITKRQNGTWQVELMRNGRRIYVGSFSSLEAAVASRRMAEDEHDYE